MTLRFILLILAFVSLTFCTHIASASLHLEDILESTENHFPELKAAFFEVEKAQATYLARQGRFDPRVRIYNRSTPLGGYENNYVNNELIVPTLINGLTFFTGYRLGQGDFEIWDQYHLTNSSGEFKAGFEIPLLRNSAIDQNRADLVSSHEYICIQKAREANILLQSYQQAIVLYWAWVNAGKKVAIYEGLLRLAEKRQKAVEKRVKQGDVASIDAVENQQFIMQRRQLLNQAKLTFNQASINLSLFYRNKRAQPQLPEKNQLPSNDELLKLIHQKFNKPSEHELDLHPGLDQLRRLNKVNDIFLKLYENHLMPELNLRAYIAKDNGSGVPRKGPTEARLGLNLKFPVYQREAKGLVLQTKAEIKRVDAQYQLFKDKLKQSLSNLIISSQTLLKQYELAVEQLGLAKQVQVAESKRFQAGGSSLFLVNQWEQNTVQTQILVLDDLTHYLQQIDLLRHFVISPIKAKTKAFPQHE